MKKVLLLLTGIVILYCTSFDAVNEDESSNNAVRMQSNTSVVMASAVTLSLKE